MLPGRRELGKAAAELVAYRGFAHQRAIHDSRGGDRGPAGAGSPEH
jgi:hypothetical protein